MVFLLNSAPGVGKTTLLKSLRTHLSGFAFIDGDNIGDVAPLENTDQWLNAIQDNICSCCLNFRRYGWAHIIASFVFPSAERIERLRRMLETESFDVRIISLICSAGEIERRIRKRNTSRLISADRAVELNGMIDRLDSDCKVNTTYLDDREVADMVLGYIGSTVHAEGERA